MLYIRSTLFTVFLVLWTLIICVLGVLLFPFKSSVSQRYACIWGDGLFYAARYIAGIKLEVKGMDNLPKEGGYIIASKHQSAYETVVMHHILPLTTFIFKIEMAKIPFMGWLMLKAGNIPVDRKGGTKAMREMFLKASERLKEGRTIIIFPEGTRTLPDAKVTYNPGVALLYEKCEVPVVPAAINSGYLWPKNSFLKRAGTITLEFLPPIQKGLSKREFLTRLETDIEGKMLELPKPNPQK